MRAVFLRCFLLSFPLNDVPLVHRSHILLICIAQVYCRALSTCYVIIFPYVLGPDWSHDLDLYLLWLFISIGSLEALLQVHKSEFDPDFSQSHQVLDWNFLLPSRSRGNEGNILSSLQAAAAILSQEHNGLRSTIAALPSIDRGL